MFHVKHCGMPHRKQFGALQRKTSPPFLRAHFSCFCGTSSAGAPLCLAPRGERQSRRGFGGEFLREALPLNDGLRFF